VSTTEDGLSRLEARLGRLLVTGVTISAAALGVGLLIWLIAPSSTAANLLLKIGLFVLMATPILRVIVSAVEYIRMRDWFFVATTLAVLAVLGVTIFYAITSTKTAGAGWSVLATWNPRTREPENPPNLQNYLTASTSS
jgi:uncharacterized membrane protein